MISLFYRSFSIRPPKVSGYAGILFLSTLFAVSFASANEYKVKRNPDKSLSYVFANNQVCNKSADYDTAIKADASISIKKLFSLGGSVEKTAQKLKQLSPKAQDFESLAFDLCFELASGRISKEGYQKRRALLDELRYKALAGNTTLNDDAKYENVNRSCITEGDKSPVVCGATQGDVIINIQ